MYQTMLSLGTPEAIRQRLASWLNRATYDPTLVGHFALNLPAYTHFTSPIRRLADLINHRIVKARLRGQETPYSKTELEQLGKHIAQVTRDNEKQTSDYFKEKHQELYQAQVQDTEELANTSEKEFSKVLKYAIEKQEMEALLPELKMRLDTRKLQLIDLYLLLFESEDKALQQKAYENLKGNVQDAASIISMATAQQVDWESFDYLDMQQSQTAPFHAWLEIKINENILTTVHPIEHQRKQPAHHKACLQWIESYLKDALVPPEQRIVPEPPEQRRSLLEDLEVAEKQQKQTKASKTERQEATQSKLMHPILKKELKDGQLFVSLLMQLCQGLCLQNPEFEFQESEAGFTCECKLEAMNERFMGTGTATKKQRAKHLAARNVLEQLQAKAGF